MYICITYTYSYFYSAVPLPAGVYDCGDTASHFECSPCVGASWYSKESYGRVNAVQICIDQGYSGEILTYGGNYGTVCRYADGQEGGELTNYGQTVSWKCESKFH